MPVSEISMALTSIRAALDLVKFISDSHKTSAIKDKTIELRDAIISIQLSFTDLYERYSTLLGEQDNLKKEIMQFKQWETTESHYRLIKGRTGSYVYCPNDMHPNPDPLHYLCTNCYDKRKKSILQDRDGLGNGDYFCPGCKMDIFFQP